MGGEGAQWIGRAPFTNVPHMIQNIGDGTYFHSGSLVPRFAVASGANITFRILYNGVIAMTGGQMPAGQQTIPDLCQSLLGEGVKQVAVVTDEIDRYTTAVRRDLPPGVIVHDRSQLETVEVEFAKVLGVTAIIYDQACSNELRRLRKREVVPDRKKRIVINEAVCEGCGDCGVKSTCLSVQPVESILGRKTQIHQGSCNTDYSCLDGDCPSFVTVEADRVPSRTVVVGDIQLPVIGPPREIAQVPVDGFGVYTVGVGGTGLVTLNQILATAAAFDGLHVTGLDQTGLSQKGGPVVSHLKMFREPTETSQSISEQSVDTFIALDLLVANELRHRLRLSPERTMAVLSTSVVPTAEMVLKTEASFGSTEELVASIGSCVSPTRHISLDILAIAEGLFKDHMTANIIALGVAYQRGFLPVREESLLRAIEVNGAAVERSKKAFAVGRLAADDPVALAKLLPQHRAGQMNPSPSERAKLKLDNLVRAQQFEIASAELRDFVLLLGAELVDYQNERVASEFLQTVASIAKLERRLHGAESELTRLAALHLFRLTAVKDEYEVARLHRKFEFQAALNELVPQGKKVKYLLQPPMMSSLGLKKKIAIPSLLARPTFSLLAAMRRVRSTPFDIFGFAQLRREERQLRLDFIADIELVVNSLCPENKADSARLLDAAAAVRGFEDVKRRSMKTYYESRSLLRAAVASAASTN
jgi:indolepyruvate ferredoxin oxidoreductase